ncbi:MAG: RnfABCDGE type electron transport complex subunit D [Candidatus Symbiothrix sp.]|jgi:electron transport complex protein RnfD|nr:RnfABCDGE type electron transport complex subunit D [Candidatus Symbiothrix sp.]
MNKLIISPSPHIHGEFSTQRLMRDVIIALLPAMLVSFYFFGIQALAVVCVAVASCVTFEYLIQKFLLKRTPTLSDLSAVVTGLILSFNLPSNLPLWLVVMGSLIAIGVGKMTFGGLGSNPFNPALVGRVFLLIARPVEMTSWPVPLATVDGATGATPLAVIKEGLKNGQTIEQIKLSSDYNFDYFDTLWGTIGGSLGEVSAVALLLGFAWLLLRKVITWHIPVSIFATVFVFSGILYLVNPNQFIDPVFHLLTGGLIFGAVYMATDYVTSPMTHKGMIVYGIGIGLITILIRVFGSYPEGISFAILFMNALTPLINKYMKPKLFGEVKK